jgi:hypothetical protein
MVTVLASVAAALLAVSPFVPPKIAATNEKMKCDSGTVIAVDTAKGELKVKTAAGEVAYKAGNDVQVVGADGKPAGAVSGLKAGAKVRVYYALEKGAVVTEVDLVE